MRIRLVTLVLLLSLPALGQVANPDKVVEEDAVKESVDPDDLPPEPEPVPALPSADDMRRLEQRPTREIKGVLRRAARTAPDAERRALGLSLLARKDARRATARICARALRLDDKQSVRRAAAECLGRLPAPLIVTHTPDLRAALDDESLDVVTMVGWAIANGGDKTALKAMTDLAGHKDPRVGRLFYDYTKRMRARLGIREKRQRRQKLPPGTKQLVPNATEMMRSDNNLESSFAGSWLAVYGGMIGWLHGTTLPAAYGGPGVEGSVPLIALGGTVLGLAAGGTYGFTRVKRLVPSHTVVQLGALGTLAGYGAGILSAPPPKRGLNIASFSLLGTVAGTAAGITLVEFAEPTGGAVALGLASGLGTAVSFGGIALGFGFDLNGALGVGFLSGGLVGGLTTVVASPFDFGLSEIAISTASGLTLATVSGLTVGLIESAALASQPIAFTEATGFAIGGGYVVGAMVGLGIALAVDDRNDPLKASAVTFNPPSFGTLAGLRDPTQAIPVTVIGGTF